MKNLLRLGVGFRLKDLINVTSKLLETCIQGVFLLRNIFGVKEDIRCYGHQSPKNLVTFCC